MRIFFCLLAVALTGCVSPASHPHSADLRGSFGTYDGQPRLENGRVNIDRLLSELAELKARTYNWLIWHGKNDWDDLQEFLPKAAKQHVEVWVTVVPPSESPPRTKHYSEPYRLDYEKWAVEIGALSRREPNLVAWSIDDFCYNRKLFTPDEARKMTSLAHAQNPSLAFVPCCYYRDLTLSFAEKYVGFVDGILFPYRAESEGMNMDDASKVGFEVGRIRSVMGPSIPVIVDVYATPHSKFPNGSQPPYIRAVMNAARKSADGVMIYCHQEKTSNPEKFEVIQDEFHRWAGEKW